MNDERISPSPSITQPTTAFYRYPCSIYCTTALSLLQYLLHHCTALSPLRLPAAELIAPDLERRAESSAVPCNP